MKRSFTGLGLLILFAYCAGLGWHLINSHGMTEHEVFAVIAGSNHYESNGILYYQLIQWLSGEAVATGATVVLRRSLSLLCGLGTLCGVYHLGFLLGGSRRCGLYSAFVLAINALFMASITHARFFGLAELCFTWSTVALVVFCRRGRWRYWVFYLLLMVAGLCSMVVGGYLLALQAVLCWYLAVRKRRVWTGFVVAVLVSLALFSYLWWRDGEAMNRFTQGTEGYTTALQAHLHNGTCGHLRPLWMDSLRLRPGWRFGFGFRWRDALTADERVHCLAAASLILWLGAFWLALRGGRPRAEGSSYVTAYRGLFWGIIANFAGLALLGWLYRQVVNAPICCLLLPFEAVLLGYVLERWRVMRIFLSLTLLLAPFHMFWLTYINGDGLDRTMAQFWPTRAYSLVCLCDHPLSFSLMRNNIPNRALPVMQRADLYYYEPDSGKVLYATDERLSAGLLGLLLVDPRWRGRSVWLFWGQFAPDSYIEEVLFALKHSPRCRWLSKNLGASMYVRFE